MALTSESINFRYVSSAFGPVQTVYTVPASKVAKVTFDYIGIMLSSLSSDSGSSYQFSQTLRIGKVDYRQVFRVESTSSNLNGRLFNDEDLIEGLNLWPIEGEYIKPRIDPIYMKSVGGSEKLERILVAPGSLLQSTERVSRNIYLDSNQTITYTPGTTTSLTMTSESIVVEISAEVILEDK